MLHHVVQAQGTPTRWAWLLHGILGSGQNLRTLARRLSSARPEWGFVLPDLRNHGDSHAETAPHTVAACAEDLLRLSAHLGIRPSAAIGHSFGGKVALLWGERASAERVWALDVPPGKPNLDLALQSEVVAVVRRLREVPMPLDRRDRIVEILTAAGFSPALGQWMTTNLRMTDQGFAWRFDLDGIEAMLLDYATVDAWPWLQSATRTTRVDVVRAARSDRWSDAELSRFAEPRLTLHVLENAGHWLHVDNLDGLVDLLLREGLTATPGIW